MKLFIGIVGILLNIFGIILIYLASIPKPWNIQTWSGETPKEKAYQNKRTLQRNIGTIMLILGVLCIFLYRNEFIAKLLTIRPIIETRVNKLSLLLTNRPVTEARLKKPSSYKDLELQAMCAKKAAEFYKENPPTGMLFTGYSCHYNKQLNKCFIQIADHFQLAGDWNNCNELFDVYENKLIASYQQIVPEGKQDYDTPPRDCKVAEQNCKSREEYDNLIKPYMEE